MNSATATASGVATTSAMTAERIGAEDERGDVGDRGCGPPGSSDGGRDERRHRLGDQEDRDPGQDDEDEDARAPGQVGEDAVADLLDGSGGRRRSRASVVVALMGASSVAEMVEPGRPTRRRSPAGA